MENKFETTEGDFVIGVTLRVLIDAYVKSLDYPCSRAKLKDYLQKYKPHIYSAIQKTLKRLEGKKTQKEPFNSIQFQTLCKTVFDDLIKRDEFPFFDVENLSQTEATTLFRICILMTSV